MRGQEEVLQLALAGKHCELGKFIEIVLVQPCQALGSGWQQQSQPWCVTGLRNI